MSIGLKLLWIGFLLIFTGTILAVISSLFSDSDISTGIVIVGPIPIVIGTGPYAFLVIPIAAALTIVCLVLFLFLRRQAEQKEMDD